MSALEASFVDQGAGQDRLAREFFDRPAPVGYLEEWSRRLAAHDDEASRDLVTVVIFRLHHEYLSMQIRSLVEVTLPQPLHVVPHRTNDVLLGMVNIRGQLRLCVSLHGLLGVEPGGNGASAANPAPQPDATRRLVIVQERNEAWVFPVEEVAAVYRLDRSKLRPVPATLGKGSAVSSAVFDWQEHTVGLLDESRLLASLRSRCT